MYDLDNGTEDIKVKRIKTNSIDTTEGLFIKYTSELKLITLGDNVNDIFDAYANEQIRFVVDYYGSFSLDDEGFNITANDVSINSPLFRLINTRLRLGKFSTLDRPSGFEGDVIYDSTLKKCILHNGTAWVNLDGTSLGA